MIEELLYWVWLQGVLGFANRRVAKILERFSSARGVYEAEHADLCASRLFTRLELNRMESTPVDKARRTLEVCREIDAEILPYDDPAYPAAFRNLPDPPVLLYRTGKLRDFSDEVFVAVVGPRKASDYGERAARSLSARLSRGGFSIVNGAARGIDNAAMQGALDVSGKPVALLGCGLNSRYRAGMPDVAQIAEQGCLLTEFPPDFPATKATFPLRNRLVAALAVATVVVEAPEHSGTLITARYALDQGKDLYVIPGIPGLPQYAGSNRLLRDGAHPLLDAVDLFAAYAPRYPHRIDPGAAYEAPPAPPARPAPKNDPPRQPARQIPKPEPAQNAAPDAAPQKRAADGLSPDARRLYEAIDAPTFALESLSADLPIDRLLAAATELELLGYIAAVPGGRYTCL